MKTSDRTQNVQPGLQQARSERKPEGVLIGTSGLSKARTKHGKGRVSARLRIGGCKRVRFNILQEARHHV
jgi:hypothetical protein